MKLRLLALLALLFAGAAVAAEPTTWDQLCYLLEVKKESKVFRQFSRECGLQEFGKREGSFSGREGIFVNCIGDDIVIVGVRVSVSTMKLPFRLKKDDDLFSAAQKVGFTPTDEQKNRAKEYLEVIVFKHSHVLYFKDGRLFEVWKRKANQTAETTAVERPPSTHDSIPAVSHLLR